jgi:hypothetical protein
MARGRKPRLDKSERLEIWLPTSILAKVKLELYSTVEGRVPYRAMSELASELFADWLKARGL